MHRGHNHRNSGGGDDGVTPRYRVGFWQGEGASCKRNVPVNMVSADDKDDDEDDRILLSQLIKKRRDAEHVHIYANSM